MPCTRADPRATRVWSAAVKGKINIAAGKDVDADFDDDHAHGGGGGRGWRDDDYDFM